MSILVQSSTGNILVNERTGEVLDEQALRSLARQIALSSGLNPDMFEASMAASTGFDPIKMVTANGLDPQGFFAAATVEPGGPRPQAKDDSDVLMPPKVPPGIPEAPGLLPGGFTTPEQRALELDLLRAQIGKLTDPTAKATAEAQLQQILAQTANIGSGSAASAAVSRQNALDQLAEQRRQYDETFGRQKAEFNQRAVADAADRAQKQQQFEATQGLSREQLDVQRGNKMLDLANRGETYARYMYALRGKLPPQQLGGVAPALPGYPGVNALPQPTPATAVSGAAGPSSPQPALAAAQPPALPGRPNPLTMGASAAGGVRPADPYASLGLGRGTLTPQSPQALANQAPGLVSVNTGGVANRLFDMPAGVPTTFENPLQTIRSDLYSLIARPNPLARPDIDPDTGEPRSAGRYARGGLIPEKVIGVGQESGQTYEFGEKGTEAVMSNDMLERLMEVAGKVDLHQKSADGKSQRFTFTLNGPPKKAKHDVGTSGDDEDVNESLAHPPMRYGDGQGRQMMYPIQDDPQMGMPVPGEEMPTMPWMPGDEPRSRGWPNGMKPPKMETNSYAAGGPIGYSLDYNPKVFNPPDLSNIVSRGYNTPGVPLLPQVGLLTGGGQSLIPSAQSFFQALPSERSAYQGFLQDEAGVQPQDVFELTRRLAPQATGLRTPRYAS